MRQKKKNVSTIRAGTVNFRFGLLILWLLSSTKFLFLCWTIAMISPYPATITTVTRISQVASILLSTSNGKYHTINPCEIQTAQQKANKISNLFFVTIALYCKQNFTATTRSTVMRMMEIICPTRSMINPTWCSLISRDKSMLRTMYLEKKENLFTNTS